MTCACTLKVFCIHITISFSPSGDAESAVAVQGARYGLAVGKPGDTASISADSALGRSSIITGTTAGVTQFSEVSRGGSRNFTIVGLQM